MDDARRRDGFLDAAEDTFNRAFLKKGYAIVALAERERLDAIRARLYAAAMAELGLKGAQRPGEADFFDHTGRYVPVRRLNALRLALIHAVGRDESVRPALYRMARRRLEWIVGNELAMQRAPNLSIQLPGDDSSLLPLHSDVWSGNSPYEIVLWVPLVDCRGTKSMYLLPRAKSQRIFDSFASYAKLDAERLYRRIKKDLVWLEVPYGRAVLFSHSLLHGNRVNREKTARWSFNIRVKGLLTPYGVKELGETFLPMAVRPATRIGFEHARKENP